VDHVIPYQAVKHNEIWNLVLAHEFCNEDKTDNLPPRHFVESLIARNELVLKSDLPLKEELKKNIGKTEVERREKVEKQYEFAKRKIVRVWRGSESFDPSRIESYKKLVNTLGII
jgi:CRISPR/Cas system Type II protein with McrA/HNH and RuvC-like nuclease domain